MNHHELLEYFANKVNCREFLFARKHALGFRCVRCDHDHFHNIAHRGGSWECAACGYQESVKFNTIMYRSKVATEQWLKALVAMIVSDGTVTIKELQWIAGIENYGAARLVARRVKPVLANVIKNSAGLPVAEIVTRILFFNQAPLVQSSPSDQAAVSSSDSFAEVASF